jgi:hypothetical protein
MFTLRVDADQVGQAHVQADLQRQQVTAAAFALPAGGQALAPVDGGRGVGNKGSRRARTASARSRKAFNRESTIIPRASFQKMAYWQPCGGSHETA